MDFGAGGFRSFRFVPLFGGNRELPPDQQISLEIVRPTVAERLAQDGESEAALYAWRDTALKQWVEDPELGVAVKMMSPNVLTVLRAVVSHTRDWRGVTLDGRPLTDPAEICLHAPIPDGSERPLVREVYDAVQRAAGLTGDELGNFASRCGGPFVGTTPRPTDGPTAPTTAVQGSTSPASTQVVPTA
jgi:hypothetical protein